MNIGFCKVGKAVKLNPKTFGATGGDNEASAILMSLANNNPTHTYWIIGRSDYFNIRPEILESMFPYNNVKCVCDEKINYITQDLEIDHLNRFLKKHNVTLDAAVVMVGQISRKTIPKFSKNRDGSIAKIMRMSLHYSSGLIYWLNHRNIPIVEIVNDPRYTLAQPFELVNPPEVSLGQYDYVYTTKSIATLTDHSIIERHVKSKYAEMEKGFLYGKKTQPIAEKNINFVMVLNEGVPSRYDFLNEWVLKRLDNVDVYGVWSDSRALNDKRFKGSLHIDKLQDVIKHAKYTLVIPIRNGWVTAKYIEMIYAGVIPFLHPDYDNQNHLDFPKILRPATPDEMFETIKLLDSDDVLYNRILQDLRSKFLKEEYYNGMVINTNIMTEICKLLGTEYTHVTVSAPKRKFKTFE